MWTGFIFLVLTGLAWSGVGGLLSYSARRNFSPLSYLGPQSILATVLALWWLPDYGMLRRGVEPGAQALVVLMLASGAVNAFGIVILQRAMRTGHHGVAWAIGQSALVIPFLCGVLFFSEPVSSARWLGVAALLGSLASFGIAKEGGVVRAASDGKSSGHWFLLSLSALFVLGCAQSLSSLSSHYPRLADTAGLRVPAFLAGSGIVYNVLWFRHVRIFNPRVFTLAATGCVISLGSAMLLFKGLDELSRIQMLSLGFPIAVGVCILGFTLYSVLVLRESCTKWHIAGFVLGLTGLIRIALV